MKAAMALYFRTLLAVWQTRHGGLPVTPYDEDVEPFMYSGAVDDEGWISWRPVEKTVEHDFSRVEAELGVALHDSIKQYFNSFWFCSLGGQFQGKPLQLDPVQPGIELDSFSKNLRGYKQAHGRSWQQIPIGLETTEGMLVVVDNTTGEVKLENSDDMSLTTIADSLETVILGIAEELVRRRYQDMGQKEIEALTLLSSEAFITKELFESADLEDMLDSRDRPEFEDDWLRVNEEVEVLQQGTNFPATESALIEQARETAFKRAYALTGSSDVAGYVSDDFGLIATAVAVGYQDEWLNSLVLSYKEGRFPHSHLGHTAGILVSLILES